MTKSTMGLLALLMACIIWGLSPIYYKLLATVPAIEVLAHRTLWSLIFFMGVLAARGRLGRIRNCTRGRALGLTVVAATTISLNWFGFIYSIQTGHAMQASLGYYIFPLVSVMFGMMFYGDRLRPAQWMAVGLAAVAITVLTLGLHVFPAMSVMLAVTFGLYGLVKKGLGADAMVSVTAEVLILSPLAVLWLVGVHRFGWGTGAGAAAFGSGLKLSLLLVGSGVLTGLPLILFSYASQRISLPTVGLVQYLNPTLQFCLAVVIFGEAFTAWHGLAFSLIWTGLAIYSLDGWRAWRKTSIASSAVATRCKGRVRDASANPSETL